MTKALELIINIVLKHSHTLGALEEQQRDRNTDKGSKTSKREKGRETDRQKTYIEIVKYLKKREKEKEKRTDGQKTADRQTDMQ